MPGRDKRLALGQRSEENRKGKQNVAIARKPITETFKEVESEKATALDSSGLVDAADDWLLPHVGLDGLDALDELIEEVETAIGLVSLWRDALSAQPYSRETEGRRGRGR